MRVQYRLVLAASSLFRVSLANQTAFARGLVSVVCFEVAFEALNLVGDGQIWAHLLICGNAGIDSEEALVPPNPCIRYGKGSRRRKVMGARARNLCVLQANRRPVIDTLGAIA